MYSIFSKIKNLFKEKVKEQNDEINLQFIDKNLTYECMSIPTMSFAEHKMVDFITSWAEKNEIKCELDEYGNVYLTKGELEHDEYYPCVTSHLDTVQDYSQYVKNDMPLTLVTTVEDGLHYISVQPLDGQNVGVGADDKCGVCICLSMFKHLPKLKACFFLQEEVGCLGSNELKEEWFNDVGYVIGFDSPEQLRSAKACNGVELFCKEFYEKYMRGVCDSWGLTKDKFRMEPYTDVKLIREKIGLMCMNLGNGGYYPHSKKEYFIIEETDTACGLGLDLILNIGYTRHVLPHKEIAHDPRNTDPFLVDEEFKRLEDGTYVSIPNVNMYDFKKAMLNEVFLLCNEMNLDFSLFKTTINNVFFDKLGV